LSKVTPELAITLLRTTNEIGDWGSFPTNIDSEIGSYGFEYLIIPHSGKINL